MCTSHIITNVAKQNMNIMALTFSAQHVKHWTDKNKNFRQIKIILLRKCSLQSNLENAYQKQFCSETEKLEELKKKIKKNQVGSASVRETMKTK